ncbi:MAG: phage head-tail connector protein [Oceanicaulis sp.]
MTLHLLSPPAAEPVSLAEAKTWLRAGHDAEDALIGDLIAAARERVEIETGLALITRSYREILDAWPERRLSAFGQAVSAAVAPLQSVEAVRTYDRTGTETVFDPAEYRVETGEPGRVIAVYPFSLPRPDARGGRIEIDFTAGYGASADAVPAALREAVLRLVGEAYSDTERAESARRGEGGLPDAVEALLRPFRRVRL